MKMKKTKTPAQIKAYILRMGAKRTNAQMVATLKVPTMTFAGVLAGMKRKKEITNNFLKTDILKNTKTTKASKKSKSTRRTPGPFVNVWVWQTSLTSKFEWLWLQCSRVARTTLTAA